MWYRCPMKSWDEQNLRVAVEKSLTLADVVKNLGLVRTGSIYRAIRKWLLKYQISTTHFIRYSATPRPPLTPLEFVFCENSQVDGSTLVARVRREFAVPYECDSCHIGPMYNGQPLTLQLDHKNGVRNDNRILNLRFLCPNCHTQTETWGGKKRELCNPKPHPARVGKRKADHDAVRVRYDEIRNYLAVGKEFGISNNAVKKIVSRPRISAEDDSAPTREADGSNPSVDASTRIVQ